MGKRSAKSFTERFIASIKTGAAKGTWFADRDLPGFVLRAYEDGSKHFAVRYRVKGTRIRRIKSLGTLGTVTLTEARAKAREILSAASLGGDPLGRDVVPTWGVWSERWYGRLDGKAKESFHARLLGLSPVMNRAAKVNPVETDPTFRGIRAKWFNRPLDSFVPEDFEAERAALRAKGKAVFTRWRAVVHAAFEAAVTSEIIDRNPVAKVKGDREPAPRTRVLTTEEQGRLVTATLADADPYAAAGVLIALFSGARRGEILALQWSHLDLEAGTAVLPDTKGDVPAVLYIPPPLAEYLKSLPKDGLFVVAGRDPKKPRSDIKRAWERITRAADLVGVGLHSLRRTFTTELTRTAGLKVSQDATRHQSETTTLRHYVHESKEATRDAINVRANLIPFPAAKTA